MNTLDQQYQTLISDILHNGIEKKDRTGTGTLSVFGRQIRHKLSDGFPLLTTKKVFWRGVVEELLWFLRGETNIKPLVDKKVNIWVGDCYKRYLNECEGTAHTEKEFIEKIKTDDLFADRWGELGRVYGSMWRSWPHMSDKEKGAQAIGMEGCVSDPVDQIENLINDLRQNPDSRRLMVSAWNPLEVPNVVLPPCHYAFQCWTRELSLDERDALYRTGKYSNGVIKLGSPHDHSVLDQWGTNIPKRAISLMWNQRSVDLALGWPVNCASYSLLLMLLAKQVNMVPDEIICNLGDTHIYLDHIDGVKEQLARKPFSLPTLIVSDRAVNDISEYTFDDFTLEGYESHGKIFFPLSN